MTKFNEIKAGDCFTVMNIRPIKFEYPPLINDIFKELKDINLLKIFLGQKSTYHAINPFIIWTNSYIENEMEGRIYLSLKEITSAFKILKIYKRGTLLQDVNDDSYDIRIHESLRNHMEI